MGTQSGVVRVPRDALAIRLTCPLCQGFLREASAFVECLHTCEFSLPRPPPLRFRFVSSSLYSHLCTSRAGVPRPSDAGAAAHRSLLSSRVLVWCRILLCSPSGGLVIRLVPEERRSRHRSRVDFPCLLVACPMCLAGEAG